MEIGGGAEGRALPSNALEGSPSDPRGVICEGNDFGAGQAVCWLQYICYGKDRVIHLESFYTATARRSYAPARWQTASCSLHLQIYMPPTCRH